MCIAFRSFHIISFQCFNGPPWGWGAGSQLNRMILGVHLSGIRARFPSHSSCHLVTFSEAVSMSPHCCLMLWDVMCWSHCCWFEMPKVLQMHLWWKESSLFRSFLHGVQHSAPCSRVERMQTWYTLHLVSTHRSLLLNTGWWSALKALEACANLLSISGCILPDDEITDPKYVHTYENSVALSICSSPAGMGVLFVSVASLPVIINFVLGTLTVKLKSPATSMYLWRASSAPSLVANGAASSANCSSVSWGSPALQVYFLNNFRSCLYFSLTPTPQAFQLLPSSAPRRGMHIHWIALMPCDNLATAHWIHQLHLEPVYPSVW